MKKGYLQQAAKKFSAPVNDNYARCAIFRNLSNIAHAEGDFDKALSWSSESILAIGGYISDEEERLELETDPDMSEWRATNLQSHGRMLLRLNDKDFTPTEDILEEAELAFSDSARLYHALNIVEEATSLGWLCMVEELRGNYSEAESLTMERLLIAQKFGDEWNEQEALYSLVNLKIQTEDYTEAERLLNEMRPSEDVALYWLTLADSLPEADLIINSERIRQKVTEIITGLGLSFDEWVENL